METIYTVRFSLWFEQFGEWNRRGIEKVTTCQVQHNKYCTVQHNKDSEIITLVCWLMSMVHSPCELIKSD